MLTDEVQITPEACTLSWVKASFPLDNGTIDIDWHRDDKTLFVNVSAPSRVKVIIAPRGDLAKLQCDSTIQYVSRQAQ